MDSNNDSRYRMTPQYWQKFSDEGIALRAFPSLKLTIPIVTIYWMLNLDWVGVSVPTLGPFHPCFWLAGIQANNHDRRVAVGAGLIHVDSEHDYPSVLIRQDGAA